ncbi:MAG: response regulator [Flavipsychrobacter sp.]|jgi:signal transduction histidine kinase|nr:response regulator [Flavipsychrobacter sp.]
MEYIFENSLPAKSDIKLLVVDDRDDNLFSIETILEKDGYKIRTANSGRAALRTLLKEDDFTLILMDVQMPDLNGFETATLIYERDKLKHIPIIFITANDHGEDSVFKGYQMGGVDYIYKPINPELLRAKVAVFAELFRKNHMLLAQEQKVAAANRLLEKEIQERIQSEEKVNLLNKQLLENIIQLKATNEELERFAYVASHDLQEPLRKIILFSDQLAMKYRHILKEEGCNSVDRIMKSSERMQMLIKNILSFSRSATNSGAFEPTNLNQLLEGLISDLEVSIQQKHAVIDIDPLPVMNIMPDQFRQLFQNLIINALKFSKQSEPPHIHIYAEKVKGMQIEGVKEELYDDDFYTIYVKDNGIGFEQKYADDIFMLFKRLNSFDKYEGTGIGLSICKKIVEQHRGYISAQSTLNVGTTFTISIPVKATNVIRMPVTR